MRFRLVGKVSWAVGSRRDDRAIEINKLIEDAKNDEDAIGKARSILEGYHRHYRHIAGYQLSATLVAEKEIWHLELNGASPRPSAPKASIRRLSGVELLD